MKQLARSENSAPSQDPVCGMEVSATSAHRLTHDGRDVLFCSARCKTKFEADPAKYLDAEKAGKDATAQPDLHPLHDAAPSALANTAGAKWTCPMHPQIVRDGPGPCPICGMALEPMTPTADGAPNPELADMSRRF